MPTELDELERRKIQLEIEREALKKENTVPGLAVVISAVLGRVKWAQSLP